jgi:Dolichyl-phosphate-mannose-protein mannosyltransferase
VDDSFRILTLKIQLEPPPKILLKYQQFRMSKSILFVSTLVISAVTLVTYYPAARIGFVNNDWIYLDWVARWDLPRYLYHYLVPGAESGWYRPLFGIYFWLMYAVFGANQIAYHLAYIVLHLFNGLFVLALVRRVSGNLSVSAIAGLLFVGFPAYSKAVYWPSTPDTIAMVFYLGTIWFWLEFLQREKIQFLLLTFVVFVLALMTKESSMTLPVVLFLIDRMLVRKAAPWRIVTRRYLPFVLVWMPYLIMEYALQRSGSYVSLAGYGLGIHMFWNLLNSLATLVFPWQPDPPIGYALLTVAIILFVSAILMRKSIVMVFLGILVLLNLVPVIGFPSQWFEMRYLYGAAIASAILFAIMLDGRWTKMRERRSYLLLVSGVVAVVSVANATSVADAASSWGEIARQRAVPFRDIQRSNPAFSSLTKLYFIDSKTTPVYDLSVMFLLRYGKNVIVDGTDDSQSNQVARLREAPMSYVYYFDEAGKPIQVPVAHNIATLATPALAVTFSAPIQLEGYEIADNSIKRGDALVLFLYWRATKAISEDYTVFVHLVDSSGKVIASHDSQPHSGKSPTSGWEPGQLIVDPIVLQIPHYISPGLGHKLEVGMYIAASGERLTTLDSNGNPINDKISIESFQITE